VQHPLDVCRHARGIPALPIEGARAHPIGTRRVPDLADVRGQSGARRALEAAAAAEHSLLWISPTGGGRSMLAQRLPGILPPLCEEDVFETAALRSLGLRCPCTDRFHFARIATDSRVAVIDSPPQPWTPWSLHRAGGRQGRQAVMNAITGTRWGIGALACSASGLVHAQSLVGRTEGEASVSVTGAARYAVPLALPPGHERRRDVARHRPRQPWRQRPARCGFQLAGFLFIERCPRNLAQDGSIGSVVPDANGRHCLDGKRLRLTSGICSRAGSQYLTEVEDFPRVTAFGAAGSGPACFQVEARDGRSVEYGATPRARAVNGIRVRSGNPADYSCIEDATNGSDRPLRIEFAGNSLVGTSPYCSVSVIYQAQPTTNTSSTCFAGETCQPNRLARAQRWPHALLSR